MRKVIFVRKKHVILLALIGLSFKVFSTENLHDKDKVAKVSLWLGENCHTTHQG